MAGFLLDSSDMPVFIKSADLTEYPSRNTIEYYTYRLVQDSSVQAIAFSRVS